MLTISTAPLWVPCSMAGPIHCDTGPNPLPAPTYPDDDPEDTQARREGRAAHWVAEMVLRGDAESCDEMEGETAPNGWIVDAEMCRHAQGYVNVVRSVGGELHAEQPLRFRDVIAGRTDAAAVSGDKVLCLFNFKYGRRIVEVEQNWSLLAEAVCMFDPDRHAAVIMTVVQPRQFHPDGPVRQWKLTMPEIVQWASWLVDRARAALGPDPVATPGFQCRDCAGAHACYALARSSYARHQVEEDRRMVKLTGEQLAHELAELRLAEALINARLKAMEGEAQGRMKTGEYLHGLQMRDRFGDRSWMVTPFTIKMLTGIDPHKPALKSPAELEREGALPNIVDQMTTRPFIGRKLAPLTRKDFDRAFKDHPAVNVLSRVEIEE